MSDVIQVDTSALENYANRLHQVNSRIQTLDRRMDSLYRNAGLLDMVAILRADLLVSYSRKLKNCEDYLRHTATAFENVERQLSRLDPTAYQAKTSGVGRVARGGGKSVVEQIKHNIGKAVVKTASQIKSRVDKTVKKAKGLLDSAVKSYLEQGIVYKAWQYGKVVMKAAGAVGKITAGIAACTSGVGVVVGVCSIVSGVNDLFNSGSDIALITQGKYDQVGKENFLRDHVLAAGAGKVGEALGNREAGEKIGKGIYYGMDVVASVVTLNQAYGAVKQADPVNFKAVAGEIKEMRKISLDNVLHMNVEDLKYQAKLASYTYKETTNLVKNAGLLYKVGEKAVSLGKDAHSLLTLGDKSITNPVLDFFDDVSKNVKRAGKGWKCVNTVTRFAFG